MSSWLCGAAYPEPDRTKLIRQVTQEEAPGLRKLNRHVPPDLATIVHKAMAREPGQRYATAEAVAEDLRRFIEGRPIEARRVSGIERAWRWCRRNRAFAALLGGIALAPLLGTAISNYFALRAIRGERLALLKAAEAHENARSGAQATERANKEAQRARTAELESDERLYVAEISLAQQAWQDGRMDRLQQALRRSSRVSGRIPIDAASSGTTWGVSVIWTSARCGTQAAWRSARTAVSWRPPAETTRSRSGTRRRARSCSRCAVIRSR